MNINKSKLSQAFSLIELMVVIAIVALLTAIAIPSYQSYLTNAKVTEVFSIATDQMHKWQAQYNKGDDFNVTTPATGEGIGQYIRQAIITGPDGVPNTADNAVTEIASCPVNGANGAGLGVVCILLNSSTSGKTIDPSLVSTVIYFTPSEAGSVTGDTSNTTINWACNFVTSGNTDIDDTVTTLLSPGNCTVQ